MDKPQTLITNNKRLDGRAPEDMRPLKIIAGYLEKADGSAYVECGSTKVVAAVYGPRDVHPKHCAEPDKAIVRCKYDMAAFSVDGERKRPGPDRRSVEISKVCSEALESVILTRKFPKTAIDIFVEVIQADASTRVTGLTAASVALADAGIPMQDLISACSFGRVYGTQNGEPVETVVVDLDKAEDNWGLADIAFAYAPNLEKIALLQMDGRISRQEFSLGMSYGMKVCKQLYELQKAALKKKYE